jgi:hypothetical protein
MSPSSTIDPTALCEEILREERRYNEEHEILPSEVMVIDRLLCRSAELHETHAELCSKLGPTTNALRTFFGIVVSTAAFWNPTEIERARVGRERLKQVNARIGSRAAELAVLLEERAQLHDHSGFSGATHYHVAKVIEEAAAHNHLYNMWVKPSLKALRGEFGLKYWPSLAEFVDVIARDAAAAELEAMDSITAAGTEASRSSRADYFKALFEAIEENRTSNGCFLPASFRLTDNAIASLANCSLDLGVEEMVDAAYVKRLRQRERERRQRSAIAPWDARRSVAE